MKPFVRSEVIAGLQLLVTLRLSNAPPSDGIEATANGWLLALEERTTGWDEKQDQGRISKAFTTLAAETIRWPPPAALIDRIPPRPPVKQIGYDKRLTPEQKVKGKANLQQLKTIINDVLKRI